MEKWKKILYTGRKVPVSLEGFEEGKGLRTTQPLFSSLHDTTTLALFIDALMPLYAGSFATAL